MGQPSFQSVQFRRFRIHVFFSQIGSFSETSNLKLPTFFAYTLLSQAPFFLESYTNLFVDSRKLTQDYRNFTFIRTYFIVVLLQHNKLVERQQQHSIVVIQQQQREWVWETRPTVSIIIII